MFGIGYNGFNHCFDGYGILISLIILTFILISFMLMKRNKNTNNSDSALSELKIRLIRGEISEEEYLKMKKIIDDK